MSDSQIWFFLYEDAKSSLSLPNGFKQGYTTLDKVKQKGITLPDCIEIVGIQGDINANSFWIHSNSMKAAVQLLSDESIKVTWSLYCRTDAIVTIHIRKSTEPSPNTSRAASHGASLAERRKISGPRINVSEVFIRPPLRHVSADLDSMTLEPIKDLSEADKVILDIGGGKIETFSKDYLLGWITSQILDGKGVTNITVCTLTRNQRPKEVLLTDDVWMTSLLRGPWKDEFQQIWETRKRITVQRNSALEELNAIPGFAHSTKMFIRDLRYFGRDQEAQNRLNDTKHEYYLGGVYFSKSTVKKILDLPVGNGNLKSELEKLSKRKTDRGEGDELCASHDLSPLYEVALGLDWKKLKNDDLLRDMGNLGLGQKKKSATGNMRQGLIKKASTMFGKKKDGNREN